MTVARVPSVVALAMLALTPACTSWSWSRQYVLRQPDTSALARLQVNSSDLEDCLAELGAPLIVEEVEQDVALYYAWIYQRDWGVSVSVPIGDDSVSFSYTGDDRNLRAVQLMFDERLTLTELREGRLGDLRDEARSRPQMLEE